MMKKNYTAITGAAFLMATSAIGPGFLTQTSLFTEQLLTSFGFVILISILLDIGAQLNIWQIITVSETNAQDIANAVVPGLGYFLAALIACGGLAFNIGNIAGCALGLQVITGMDVETDALISCLIALGVFWYKDAGKMIDRFATLLGFIMIVLTIYIAVSSRPPLGEALYRTIFPEKTDVMKIVTLVGGTVGGYISFAGAHRLLDAGMKGRTYLVQVTKSSVSGIVITSAMRYILFLAALGIVSKGIALSPTNPAATVFQTSAGHAGYIFFGIVLWCAAITSVVGASFTSISFWKTLVPAIRQNEKVAVSGFIILATALFLALGQPIKLLVLAGLVNGLILPLSLAAILLAAHKKNLMKGHSHPLFLQIIGWLVVGVMAYMGFIIIQQGIRSL